MLPQLVICHKCGAVLYEGEELKASNDIISDYDGKCPACGKKLSHIPKHFEIKPIDETNQPNPFEPGKKRPSRKKSRNKTKKLERKRNAHSSYESRSGSIWKN